MLLKQVGPNYNDSEYAALSHSKCTEQCPASCSNPWSYFRRDRYLMFEMTATIHEHFVVDTSINVSCGKNWIILHQIVYIIFCLINYTSLILSFNFNSITGAFSITVVDYTGIWIPQRDFYPFAIIACENLSNNTKYSVSSTLQCIYKDPWKELENMFTVHETRTLFYSP